MRMYKRKGSKERFERMNAQRKKTLIQLRRKMFEAAMAGGRSGFAVQMRIHQLGEEMAAVSLRTARPRERGCFTNRSCK